MHQVGQHRLFVSKFRNQALQTGQSVHIIRAPSYWQKVRDAIDLAIIDVPSRDRSRTLLAIAPDVDGVVLVAEHGTDPNELTRLQHEVESAGGNCLGIIFNASGELPQNSQQQTYQ
jgi:Mrp family chromosome partitioning ATPase